MSATITNLHAARALLLATAPAYLARIRLTARARGCNGAEARAAGSAAEQMLAAGVDRRAARQRALSIAEALVRQRLARQETRA